MLYIIGLGLGDEKDISVRGLEIVKNASRVYLEAYTAILGVETDKLESLYGRPVELAYRETVESESDTILDGADTEDVALLVVGDPFSATTHTDLMLRARERKVAVRTLPNASILTAVGATGLSLYNMGPAVSLPLFGDKWRPTSFYHRLAANAVRGLHTLLLLDIRVREPDPDQPFGAHGRLRYAAPRFMTAAEAARQLLDVERECGEGWCAPDRLAVAAARVGSDRQAFVVGTLDQLAKVDMGPPLHCLVLIGSKTHDIEREALLEWALDKPLFDRLWSSNHTGNDAVA